MPGGGFTGSGSGFTSRLTTSWGDIVEDEIGASAGSYAATAPVTTGGWVMQMAAFKAAVTSSGGPAGYTFCANEGGTCSFTGTMSVAFGANGLFNYKTLTGGTPCTTTVFGDPDYGVVKACYDKAVVTGDTTPPSVPTGLTASAISSLQISLSWAASTDPDSAVAGYKVFRGGLQIGTTTGTSYANTGLSPGTTYSYTVAAYDAAGNTSAPSAAASATTPASLDTTPPSVPTNLTAKAVSSSQINLAWTASTDNVGVAGYKVFKNSSQIATTGSTSYSVTGLSPSTSYSFAVSAYDAAGNNSLLSNTVSATTQATSGTGCGAGCNNYYVSTSGSDANSGMQASPWRTIQHADSALALGSGSGSTVVNCGDGFWAGETNVGACVHVAPGTYTGSEIVTTHNGTAS